MGQALSSAARKASEDNRSSHGKVRSPAQPRNDTNPIHAHVRAYYSFEDIVLHTENPFEVFRKFYRIYPHFSRVEL